MQAAQTHLFRLPAAAPLRWASPSFAPLLRRASPAVLPAASPPEPQQWLWHSRFGTIVIEVHGSEVYVNGDRVVPHAP